MGHNICAIVGRLPIDENKAIGYGLAVIYEKDFVIIPLVMDSIYYWSDKLSLSFDSRTENIEWDCELVSYLASKIGLREYCIIQTDYFGGFGDQWASFYRDDVCIMTEVSINEVLRELGVKAAGTQDEFDVLNLSDYRHGERYYWDSYNPAIGKMNMIPGKIFRN